MEQLKIFKSLLPLVLTLFFTACGGGGSSTADTKAQAMTKIEAYANDNSQTAPTLEDYSNAGVQGVTTDNLGELNSLVAGLTAEDVDTVEEINALTATLGLNIIPTANAQAIIVNEDTSNNVITLTATDADSDNLTFTVVTQPSHGTLSGTAPNLTYTPTANYAGSDSFTFKANDGTVDSSTATVSITVTDVAEPNTSPVANAQTVTVNEDTSNNAITLTATDADADNLTFTVVTQPSHGTLSGTAPSLTYTPTANYAGADSFTFKANDGTADSATVTVSITVTDVAEPDTTPPVVTLNGDANVSIYLNESYTELNATATDNVDGNVSASIVITGNVDTSVVGENIITYTATDSAGNQANVTRTVNVLQTVPAPDTTPPVVTLNGDVNVSIYLNEIYTELNATATDDVDGNVSASIVITGTVDTSVVGENNLTYTATDSAGNQANVTRMVNVLQTVKVLSPLKKTGQTKSYEIEGEEVLDGSVKDDGHYQKGTTPSYTRDDIKELVTDNLTGLMWQDDAAVFSVIKPWLTDDNYNTCDNDKIDPACSDTTGDTATTYCNELVMGGYEDWRLPTRTELQGLAEYGNPNSGINSIFENTELNNYWSSTTHAGSSHRAWKVDFNYGNQGSNLKNASHYVRCVRSAE